MKLIARTPQVTWVFLLMMLSSYPLVQMFGTAGNWSWNFVENTIERSVTLLIVAVGQTFAVLIGSIDLSVAFVISLAAVLAGFIMQGDPAMIWIAVPTVLTVGCLIGMVNGLLIARLKVNPLIATLGVGLVIQGILSTSFQNFAGAVPEAFQQLAYGRVLGVPISFLVATAVVAIAYFVLNRTVFGAHVYGVGGNQEGARLSGVRVRRTIIATHVIVGFFAALAGLYLASRLGSGAPWVGKDGIYDLESIAAVVIGGTILSGGRGGVIGTLFGVLIIGFLDSLFNQLGIDPYLKQVLRGGVIVFAVAVYSFRQKGEVA